MDTIIPNTTPYPPVEMLDVPMWFILIIVAIVLIELALKGVALWRSSQNKNKVWFIALFLFNTMGILPIIYLLTHKKEKEEVKPVVATPNPDTLPKL